MNRIGAGFLGSVNFVTMCTGLDLAFAISVLRRERILFNQLDAASGMWTVAIPTARTAMTPHELREVAAGYFFLPSPCLAPVVGCQIILPSTEHNPVIVDLYGDALMNLPAPGDAHWRVQHDAIADAFRDHCVHDLGIAVRREVDDLFQQAVPLGNTVPMDELKDLVPDAELSLPAFNVVTGSYDPRSLKSTLLEFKTMRYGVKYTSVPRATAVDRFERPLLGDIQRGLAARDAAWHNTEAGQKGPLRDILDMSEYTGMVFGTVASCTSVGKRPGNGNATTSDRCNMCRVNDDKVGWTSHTFPECDIPLCIPSKRRKGIACWSCHRHLTTPELAATILARPTVRTSYPLSTSALPG
eukprot:jgi/Tetstr1/434105/TSEL_023249.t1